MILNDWRIDPMPVVIGAAQYPEHIIETLEQTHKVYTINATEEAKKLGNPRVFKYDRPGNGVPSHGFFQRSVVSGD